MDQKKWNVVFLIDLAIPTKIILLKRAATKDYAPDWYTGIGGKIGDLSGLENETPIESAYRELEEETQGELKRSNVVLSEFARNIYQDNGICLYYFWGIYSKPNPPKFDPDDGQLYWVNTSDILSKEIIPTTFVVCQEWAKRNFHPNNPFTVFVTETGLKGTVRLIEVQKIEEGLK